MANYVFALPIQPGKTEVMKGYAREMEGPRREEFRKRNQQIGLRAVQVWIQHTPDGDLALVRWETDDPRKAFEQMAKSDDPFEKWFREKIMVETFGRDPAGPVPPINEQIVDYREQSVGEKAYSGTRTR
jgi:hypothetical protein